MPFQAWGLPAMISHEGLSSCQPWTQSRDAPLAKGRSRFNLVFISGCVECISPGTIFALAAWTH